MYEKVFAKPKTFISRNQSTKSKRFFQHYLFSPDGNWWLTRSSSTTPVIRTLRPRGTVSTPSITSSASRTRLWNLVTRRSCGSSWHGWHGRHWRYPMHWVWHWRRHWVSWTYHGCWTWNAPSWGPGHTSSLRRALVWVTPPSWVLGTGNKAWEWVEHTRDWIHERRYWLISIANFRFVGNDICKITKNFVCENGNL